MELRKDPITRSWVIVGDDVERQGQPGYCPFCPGAPFEGLAISMDHAVRAGLLPGPHKDPFDRMLIAQAQAESVPILSSDAAFDVYGVRRLW